MKKVLNIVCLCFFTSLIFTEVLLPMDITFKGTKIFVPNHHRWTLPFADVKNSIKDDSMKNIINPMESFYGEFNKNIRLFDSIVSFLKSKASWESSYRVVNYLSEFVVESISCVEVDDQALTDLAMKLAYQKDPSYWEAFFVSLFGLYSMDDQKQALSDVGAVLQKLSLLGETCNINIAGTKEIKSFQEAVSHRQVLAIREEFEKNKTFVKALKTFWNTFVQERSMKEITQKMAIDKAILEKEKCSICLKKFTEAKRAKLIALTCGHVFHQECIDGWIATAQSQAGHTPVCPLCRKEIKD